MRTSFCSLLSVVAGATCATAVVLPRQTVTPTPVAQTRLHVLANQADLGELSVTGETSVSFVPTGQGTTFFIDMILGFLYAKTDPASSQTQNGYINFVAPSTGAGSGAAICGTSGALTFAGASPSSCASNTPFKFFGSNLLYGNATGGTFQLCGEEIVFTTAPSASCTNIQLVRPPTPQPGI